MGRARKKAEHAVPAATTPRKKAEHPVPAATGLSAGKVVSATFGLTLHHALPLVGLVLATQGPWALLQAAGALDGIPEADAFRWEGLYGMVAGVLESGAIVWVVAGAMGGERRGVGDALRRAGRRYFSLLGASLQSAIWTLLYALLLVVPGVLKALSYAVVLPVVMLEDKGASASLARSTQLMDGHRSAAFVAMCITFPLAVGPSVLGLAMPGWPSSDAGRAAFGLFEGVLALPLEVMGVVLYSEAVSAHTAFRREVFAGADGAPSPRA